MRRIFNQTMLPIFLGLLAGCASLEPFVQDFNIISIPQEQQLGMQLEAEIAKEMTVVEDAQLSSRVQSVGKRLVAGLLWHDFDYRFHVVKDDTPNAFTIPGGVVYVHTGLLKLVDDDSELAGVIGHEIGHAYRRHPSKALSRAYGVQYLSKLLFKKSDEQGKFRKLALDLAKGGVLSRYGRQDEYEADEAGFVLVRKAGYSTRGFLTFLGKIQKLEGTGRPIPFLSSHPPTPDRIARLESFERGTLQASL